MFALGLILLAMAGRFAPHPPNVTPLTAVALLGGAYLPKRWAIAVPLAAIVLSDLVIGLHDVVAFTWTSIALISLLGWWIRRRPEMSRIALASVLGSTFFFLLTNFGVWLLGDQGTMYPRTLEGLGTCYVAALPFFRNALLGDLVITSTLFGLCAWAMQSRASRVV